MNFWSTSTSAFNILTESDESWVQTQICGGRNRIWAAAIGVADERQLRSVLGLHRKIVYSVAEIIRINSRMPELNTIQTYDEIDPEYHKLFRLID